VTLEVGGDLETYWKSTAMATGQTTQLAPPRVSRRTNHIGSVQASPVNNTSHGGGQALTISSQQGSYVYVVVQVTRDLHPVVFFDWLLPGITFELGVTDVTLAQYEALAKTIGKSLSAVPEEPYVDWVQLLHNSMVSLGQLLKVCIHNSHVLEKRNVYSDIIQILPPDVNLLFDLAYPSETISPSICLHRLNLNNFVDSVLQTIFDASGTTFPRRKITFTSFSPDVCSSLNWKQPNCMPYLM